MAGFNYFPQAYVNPYLPSFYPQVQQPMPAGQMPSPQQPAQQGNAPSGILWVTSEAEAQAYPVAPNNAVALWDSSRPAVYIKQADASGKPILKAYDLTERTLAANNAHPAPQEGKDTAIELKREINALWEAVEEIRQKSDTARRNTRRKEATDDDAE